MRPLLLCCLLFSQISWGADNQTSDYVVKAGMIVTMEYVLALKDGTVLDTNLGEDSAPLVFEQGGQQLLPALERALDGLVKNDEKFISIGPEFAYGGVDPEYIVEDQLDKIPEAARKVGTEIVARDRSGKRRKAVIKAIDKEKNKATLDFNHPLAGETLIYRIRIVDVQPKPAESRSES